MERHESIILVTGATGRQGGCCSASIARRRMERARADAQHRTSLRLGTWPNLVPALYEVTFADRPSVDKAIGNGVYGVFAVQSFFGGGSGRRGETGAKILPMRQRKRAFSILSTAPWRRRTAIAESPFFESKWEIEQYIRSLNLPATIFRPVFFMENMNAPNIRDSILEGTLALPIPRDQSRQNDRGRRYRGFRGARFCKAGRIYGYGPMRFAGDELTMTPGGPFFHSVHWATRELPGSSDRGGEGAK